MMTCKQQTEVPTQPDGIFNIRDQVAIVGIIFLIISAINSTHISITREFMINVVQDRPI